MILGTVSLFQKRGIFYKEMIVSSEDTFSETLSKELTPDHQTEFLLDDVPQQYRLIPVDESGDTDYITAIFEDDGKAQYPYEVTIWALVEEVGGNATDNLFKTVCQQK